MLELEADGRVTPHRDGPRPRRPASKRHFWTAAMAAVEPSWPADFSTVTLLTMQPSVISNLRRLVPSMPARRADSGYVGFIW
jgi:hypothetical protein